MNEKYGFFPADFTSQALSALAIEQIDCSMGESLHAPCHREYTDHGCRISHANPGDGFTYHTLITGKLWLCGESERAPYRTALKNILLGYMKKADFCLHSGRILFCGLGNTQITADAVGPMIADRLAVTGKDPVFRSAGLTELYAVKPGVPAQSGIGTGEHIRMLAEHLAIDLILTADAAAAKTAKRLASVVQVTDRGVWAGAGTGEHADEISSRTMPCPVISIGIPTVIRTSVFKESQTDEASSNHEVFLVSRSEIDLICQCYADLVSGALNRIFASPLFE